MENRKLHEVHLTDSYGICDIIGGINEIIRFINGEIIPSLQNKEETFETIILLNKLCSLTDGINNKNNQLEAKNVIKELKEIIMKG